MRRNLWLTSFAIAILYSLTSTPTFSQTGLPIIWTSTGTNFTLSPWSPGDDLASPDGIWLTGDFNGDGRTDVFRTANTIFSVDTHVWLSSGDGTFTARSFSPRAQYGLGFPPGGRWLVGDINGDGKADIIHVVTGTNYVRPWISRGDGTFTVGTFSPAADYTVTSSVWLTGDINRDGKMDLFHAVSGTDYVYSWISRGDGTFLIKKFIPWQGYGIPNGQWLMGDINGDGLADIVHAVLGANYVHSWLSLGDGTFQVRKFSPAADYAITNSLWLTGDLNRDGKMDLVHAVPGTSYVYSWISQGNGTFLTKKFTPWQGYGIPNGQWLMGDINGDGLADIVHAVQGANYVHYWLSLGDGTFWVGKHTAQYPNLSFQNRNVSINNYTTNGVWLRGDFNNDKKIDLLHVMAGSPSRSITIRRHTTASMSDWIADQILGKMSLLLTLKDGPFEWNSTSSSWDVPCPLRAVREGAVGIFMEGDGSIDSYTELEEIIFLPGLSKVVNEISYCNGMAPDAAGCAEGGSFVVEDLTSLSDAAIAWAHEYGHTRGLGHRPDKLYAVMQPTISTANWMVDQTECTSLLR